MSQDAGIRHVVRFGVFEVNLRSAELRKNGLRLKVQDQPFQVLVMLLERPGEVVTRDDLRERLWRDGTVVDFDHGIRTAVNKIREALGDDADNPRFVETLARRGYRFVAPVERLDGATAREATTAVAAVEPPRRRWWAIGILAAGAMTLLAIGAYVTAVRLHPVSRPERTLTRLTFEPGLQHAPTWSPDGRFIAYGSAGPTQDVWVQPVAGGNPVQVTKHPGRDWQPDWSPDGTQIVFRSERDAGGLFIVPVTGGYERKLTDSGYYPHFSPDGSRVLFAGAFIPTRLYTVALDGTPPRELAPELSRRVERVFGRWHPDGRVSISTLRGETEWGFWTLPLSGGPAVQSELAPDVKQRFEAAGLQPFFWDFAWAPSGNAIFLSAVARGMRSIFKVTVDAGTLRWTAGPQQLTFGPGDDTEVAVSADGKKLAFNVSMETTRLWVFPFDPVRRRVAGAAQPLTPDGWLPANAGLSADGRKLAFMARRRGERAGHYEVWQKLLSDGSEKVLLADAIQRGELRWSPDGARIAFSRDGKAIMIYDTRAAEEQPLASAAGRELWVTDWSPDGRAIMASGPGEDPNRYVLWLFPVSPDGQPTGPGRLVASHRDYGLYETAVSHDGRWICFEAVHYPDSRTATLYVVRPTGGAWIPVTDGRHWDDKPRWSPDGRTIFFLSNRGFDAFFLHLWAVRFDPDAGRIVGEPFQIPDVEVPDHYMSVGSSLAIVVDRLVVSLTTSSGNVWMLDNVDR